MTTFSLADAKAHLSKLVAQVSGQHERVYVTVHGKPSAVLLAPEDLESRCAHDSLFSDFSEAVGLGYFTGTSLITPA